MNAVALPSQHSTSVLVRMAQRYGVEEGRMMATLKATAFKGDVTNEQLMALCVVADQYGLNPWTKEIYAFPDRGGIVPVVGVDGWSRIINTNPQFDGMDFNEGPTAANSVPEWIECVIHRKDRSHPVKVKEYFAEVYRDNAGPWKSHPRRMLRHKAMIQCARIAFGFGGIYDEDEAQRIIEVQPTLRADPRPDTSLVDLTMRDKWVMDIKAILDSDKDEYGIADDLRDASLELSRFPELYTTVFDKLAADKIITKAKLRDYLNVVRPQA